MPKMVSRIPKLKKYGRKSRMYDWVNQEALDLKMAAATLGSQIARGLGRPSEVGKRGKPSPLKKFKSTKRNPTPNKTVQIRGLARLRKIKSKIGESTPQITAQTRVRSRNGR
jgi:hypothetical protein